MNLTLLRELSEKATKGSWRTAPQRVDGACEEAVKGHSNAIWAGTENRPYPIVALANARAAIDGKLSAPMIHISGENAAFIVEAVNFVRTLLADDSPYVVVPREPDEEMCEAAFKHVQAFVAGAGDVELDLEAMWSDMLLASMEKRT